MEVLREGKEDEQPLECPRESLSVWVEVEVEMGGEDIIRSYPAAAAALHLVNPELLRNVQFTAPIQTSPLVWVNGTTNNGSGTPAGNGGTAVAGGVGLSGENGQNGTAFQATFAVPGTVAQVSKYDMGSTRNS
jgi:hypothetical protein